MTEPDAPEVTYWGSVRKFVIRFTGYPDVVENDNQRARTFRPSYAEVVNSSVRNLDGNDTPEVVRRVKVEGRLYRKDGSLGDMYGNSRWDSDATAEVADRWGGPRPWSEAPAWLRDLIAQEVGE